jgi:hypothetical protein
VLKLAGAFCPACGGELEVQPAFNDDTSCDYGELRCLQVNCARPLAAGEVLADRETEHVVVFDEHGFSIQHPLRERIDGALFSCGLHAHLRTLDGPPDPIGRYRAKQALGGRWLLEFLS